MVLVPKSAPSAQNRYLYKDGQLHRLPSSMLSALGALARTPFLRAIISQTMQEASVPRNEALAAPDADESVDAFVTRRLGPRAAADLVSAMVHGIYAGDARTLSVKSVFPSLVSAEQTHGSLLRAALPPALNSRFKAPRHCSVTDAMRQQEVERRLDPELVKRLPTTSIYSLPEGLQEIVNALEDQLMTAPNVEVWMDAPCERIEPGDRIALHMRNATTPLYADRVVAAMPSAQLAPLLPGLPHLAHNPSANVGVVDIVLAPADRSAPTPLPVQGFGYLIPRSTKPNDDEILGVVFDSDAVPNQNVGAAGSTSFVKVTVMMGGPYWLGRTELPSEAEIQQRAMRALSTHLSYTSEQLAAEVRYIRPRVLRSTIPQYQVGHPQRMEALCTALCADPTWRGRLSLLGSSYTGVGVNDCVAMAMDTSDAIAQYEAGDVSDTCVQRTTGLVEALPVAL